MISGESLRLVARRIASTNPTARAFDPLKADDPAEPSRQWAVRDAGNASLNASSSY
jgi:hypothetical protein